MTIPVDQEESEPEIITIPVDQKESEPEIRRKLIEQFSQNDEKTREARVDRYLEINQQRIIGSTHFDRASTECFRLYRDGHFIATVMTTQAVNEGIIKFVAERNDIKHENMNLSDLLKTLKDKNIFSQICFEASDKIRGSYRNDVHHMNPPVAGIDFPTLAKRNIKNLAIVESEIWATNFDHGEMIPVHRKCWDKDSKGKATFYVRTTI